MFAIDAQARLQVGRGDSEEVRQFADRSIALGLLMLVAAVASAAAFLAWVRRSVANASILGADEGIATPAAAVMAWLIPIRNLWKPLRVMVDLHDRLLAPLQSGSGRWLIRCWWVFGLTEIAVVVVFLATSPPPSEAVGRDGLFGMTVVGIAAAIAFADAILAIATVAQIERLAHARETSLRGYSSQALELIADSQRRRVAAAPLVLTAIAIFALVLPLGAVYERSDSPLSWSNVSPSDSTFSAEMPGKARESTTIESSARTHAFTSDLGDLKFVAGYIEFPAGSISLMSASDAFALLNRGLPGTILPTPNELTLNGHTGKEWTGTSGDKKILLRLFIVADRLFVVEAEWVPGRSGAPEIARFLNSFTIR